MKVCLASSTGGHLIELKKVISAVEEHEFFFLTEYSEMSKELRMKHNVYYLKQQERKNLSFIKNTLKNVMCTIRVLFKEKPNVIISTGAGATFPVCLIGKLIGAKIIYIESFAKVKSPSLTGRLVYPFADQFYIQWEELKIFYPKAIFRGSLY